MARDRKPTDPRTSAAGVPESEAGEARIQRWLLGALAVVGPIVLLVVVYKLTFPGLNNPDALDFAQIGRNLASGRGFTTFLLRPLALSHGNNSLGQPDVMHGPLFPLCLAVAFAALHAKDSVAVGVSALFFLLTIPAVYFLGKRTFNARIGTIAATVFTVNALSLEYATSGVHLTLCIFLTTCLMLAVHAIAAHVKSNADGRFPRTAVILTGVLAALLYLAEPLFFWVIPVVGVMVPLILPRQRAASVFLFLLPILLLAGPWMARNAILTGNPVFGLRGSELWMNTKNFPGLSSYRLLPEEVAPSPGLLQEVLKKIFIGLGQVLETWPQVGGNWVLVFFLPSLFFRFSDSSANALRRIVLYCFVAVTLGMLLLRVEVALLVTFVPAMLVFAVAYLSFLIQQAQLSRGATIRLTALMAALLLYPLIGWLTVAPKPRAVPEREAAVALSAKSQQGDIVLTDKPWAVAWYADRPVLFVPLTDSKVTELRERFPGMHWLLLSQEAAYSGSDWGIVYKGLREWNKAYAVARSRKERPPDEVRISGTEPPLLAALRGFIAYPPLEESEDPVTVVAFAPTEPTGANAAASRGVRSSR